jgi:hypothetical protein
MSQKKKRAHLVQRRLEAKALSKRLTTEARFWVKVKSPLSRMDGSPAVGINRDASLGVKHEPRSLRKKK